MTLLVLPIGANAGAARRTVRPAISAQALDIAVDGDVYATARDGNTLYFGGRFTTVAGEPRQNLAAIDLTTGALTDWDPQLTSSSVGPPVSALAVTLDRDIIYVGGEFDSIDGTPRHNIAAILSVRGGELHPWNPDLTDGSAGGAVRALAVDPLVRTVYLGGAFVAVNGETREGLAAVTTVDAGTDEVTEWDPALDLGASAASVAALSRDRWESTIYVGGSFSSVGGEARANLAAISTAGVGAPSPWNPGADAPVRSFARDESNDRLYVGGDFATLGGATRPGVGAVSTEGSGATTPWYSGGGLFGCAPGLSALALNPQRTEVVVGCELPRFGSALNAVAAAGTGAPLRAYSVTGSVYSALVTAAGRLFAGGSFGLQDFAPEAPASLPTMAIATSSVEEGDAGARLARVTVSLSKPVPYEAAAHYLTGPVHATPGTDYGQQEGWVTVPAGATSAAVSFKVLGDEVVEPNEAFSIFLGTPQSARIQHGHGQVTITDDDHAPARRVGVGNAIVVEGDEATRLARFTISLSRVSPVPVSVTYFTVPGTAHADSDFTMRWAVATIPAGAMSTAATVPVVGDTTWEDKEGYTLKIIQPEGAQLGRRNASGYVLNDDRP